MIESQARLTSKPRFLARLFPSACVKSLGRWPFRVADASVLWMTFQAGLGPRALTHYTVVKEFLLLDLKIAQSPLSMRAVCVLPGPYHSLFSL